MDLELLKLRYDVLVISAFVIGSCFKFKMRPSQILAVFLIIVMSILIGSRPYDVTIDTYNYWHSFNNIAKYGTDGLFSNLKLGDEPILNFIFAVSSGFGSFNVALWVVSVLSLSLIYHSFERLCRLLDAGCPLLLFLIYLGGFYIAGQQYHIMRAGFAMAFVLNAIVSLYIGKWKSFWGYSLIAVFTHVTTLIPLLCACVVKFVSIKQWIYYMLFIGAILLSATNIGIHSFGLTSYISIEKVQAYLTGQDTNRYQLGFRPSFVIFNCFYFFILAKYHKISDLLSLYYFRLFILLSIVMFLSFQIPYFDRIGGFSWNIMPIAVYLVITQYFKKNKTLAGGLTFFATLIIAFAIHLLSGNL